MFSGLHRRPHVQQRPGGGQQEPHRLLRHRCGRPAARQGNLRGKETPVPAGRACMDPVLLVHACRGRDSCTPVVCFFFSLHSVGVCVARFGSRVQKYTLFMFDPEPFHFIVFCYCSSTPMLCQKPQVIHQCFHKIPSSVELHDRNVFNLPEEIRLASSTSSFQSSF